MATLQRGVTRHPKVSALSDGAFRLWIAGLDYCDSALTDGVILKSALANGAVAAWSAELVAELTRAIAPYQHGLWEDHGEHYQVHDYLSWNDSRATVQHNRARLRERVARHRLRQAGEDGNDVSNGVTNGVTNEGIRPSTFDLRSSLPQTPSQHGKGLNGRKPRRFSKQELDAARHHRSKAYGRCPHDPPCGGSNAYQDCVKRIAVDMFGTK